MREGIRSCGSRGRAGGQHRINTWQVLEQTEFDRNGAHATGPQELCGSDQKVDREKEQIAHSATLIVSGGRARMLKQSTPRYDFEFAPNRFRDKACGPARLTFVPRGQTASKQCNSQRGCIQPVADAFGCNADAQLPAAGAARNAKKSHCRLTAC